MKEDVTANGDHKDTKDTRNGNDKNGNGDEGNGENGEDENRANEVSNLVIGAGLVIGCAYRLDLLVEGVVVVEVKAIERLEPIDTAQVLTYLRMRHVWLGLLINVHAPVLKNGIKRVVLS